MRKKALFWISFISIFLNVYCSYAQPAGNLVIVGGGLEADNADIFNEFIRLAGGASKARIAVIPSASGVPVQSWVSFRNILKGYGLREDQLMLVPIAMADDDSTLTFDERNWKDNADDPVWVKKISQCSGVWFTGGDQIRTYACLCRGSHHTTPVLDAIREMYNSGGVIGGTSAGAAIMSNPMIGGGSSITALEYGVDPGPVLPDSDPKGLFILPGLGFFTAGIVDQHFHRRARLGRLVVALMHDSCLGKPGFGIDENTALVFYGKSNTCQVMGQGGVSIFKTDNAGIKRTSAGFTAENIQFSYLESGDRFDATSLKIQPDPDRSPVPDSLLSSVYFPAQRGLFDTYLPDFREMLIQGLILHTGNTLKSLQFTGEAQGYLIEISKMAGYQALRSGKKGNEKYTVSGLQLNIRPFQFHLTH